jgi:hypothetical protein
MNADLVFDYTPLFWIVALRSARRFAALESTPQVI